ncbi:MAG: nucleoside phosphorylase [Lachnospiraceae bacterium]|nr:nucleoside phosphorylase [Lachnospiraceae bacterium]
MLTSDFFDDKTEAIISLEQFYGEKKHIVEKCLIVFSKEIHTYLLNSFECEQIGELGACGSLDKERTKGRFVVPTESYRGEGCSHYYVPASDYIEIKNADKVAAVLGKLGAPYVKGRVWTTDSMLRETKGLVSKRKNEGCIAVEMELAGVQAVCDFYGLELFDFLEAGDVLSDSGYEVEGLHEANHSLGKVLLALEIAVNL